MFSKLTTWILSLWTVLSQVGSEAPERVLSLSTAVLANGLEASERILSLSTAVLANGLEASERIVSLSTAVLVDGAEASEDGTEASERVLSCLTAVLVWGHHRMRRSQSMVGFTVVSQSRPSTALQEGSSLVNRNVAFTEWFVASRRQRLAEWVMGPETPVDPSNSRRMIGLESFCVGKERRDITEGSMKQSDAPESTSTRSVEPLTMRFRIIES
jgi:hypothetical protein